ncbi:hypothetical protein BGX27_006961, partial [Mortierella sp. AM989]
MSPAMAQAACSHIFQTLQGHIIFLNDQGIITDESLKVILAELCKPDLQAIVAPNPPSSNASFQPQSIQDSRPSIDTDLQMLDLPSRKSTVLGDPTTPIQQPDTHHDTEVSASESDYEVDRDTDRQYQERLLMQEQLLGHSPGDHQSVDITTGELDNLVAASITDDQDQDESEVAVLEEVDDDDVLSEVKTLDRSLSLASNPTVFKPELSPLPISDSLITPRSVDLVTPNVSGTKQNEVSNSLSSFGAAPIVTSTTGTISNSAVPHLNHQSSDNSAQPTISTVATSTYLESPSASSVQVKPNEHIGNGSQSPRAEATIEPSPSRNLEQYEQNNTAIHPPTLEQNQYVPLATTIATTSVTDPVYSH